MSRRKVGPSKRAKVYRRDRWICRFCGRDVDEEDLTIDHLKPLSAGGTNQFKNLVTACRWCNSRKGSQRMQTLPIGRRRVG